MAVAHHLQSTGSSRSSGHITLARRPGLGAVPRAPHGCRIRPLGRLETGSNGRAFWDTGLIPSLVNAAPCAPIIPAERSDRGLGEGAVSDVASVIIVDDDASVCDVLGDFLRLEGLQVTATSACAAHEKLPDLMAGRSLNVLIYDLDSGSLDALRRIRARHPDLLTIVTSVEARADTAIDAVHEGAFDFILKPFKVEQVVQTVAHAAEQQRLRAENIELEAALSLYRLAEQLSGQVELGPTLRFIVQTVSEQVEADRVSVVLFPDELVRWEGESLGGPALGVTDLTPVGRGLTQAARATHGRVFRYLEHSPRTQTVSSLLVLPLISSGRPLGVLVVARDGGPGFVGGQKKLLTIVADRAAAAVHNAQLFERVERSYRETIEAFVNTLEEKDPYTRGHSERVANFCEITGMELGLPDAEVEVLYHAGRLHDIGKLAMRQEELNKPGRLTDEELERFRRHPESGMLLLARIPMFQKLLPAIVAHHETYAGTGYPRRLRGEQIPLMGRITSVADTYDAMTSHRAYRAALSHTAALAELRRCAGTQFDPLVVEAFCAAIHKWRSVQKADGLDVPR